MTLRFVFIFLCISCIRAKVVELSCADIRAFVDAHNTLRLRVASGKVPGQPPAHRMNALVWDEELATKAEKWALHNKFQHNPDKTVESERFTTGENIYIWKTTQRGFKCNARAQANSSAHSWFDEHQYYKFGRISWDNFDSGVEPTGHYTQMVWNDSTRLGCAISQFRDGYFNACLVVCNYGPAGNMVGETMYKRGKGVNYLTCSDDDWSQRYGPAC